MPFVSPNIRKILRMIKPDAKLKTPLFVYVGAFKNLSYSRVSAINPVSTRKIFLPFAFCGALEFFGAWSADDTLPYDFYGTLCVVCTKIW